MRIIYSPIFLKRYKKLSLDIKTLAEEKEVIFRKSPKTPSLKVHKLHGKLKGLWSFSVNNSYRIVFEVAKDKTVIFHSVGDHDEIY